MTTTQHAVEYPFMASAQLLEELRETGRIHIRQEQRLLLPGALLVPVGPKLLAAFVFVDFRFTALFK